LTRISALLIAHITFFNCTLLDFTIAEIVINCTLKYVLDDDDGGAADDDDIDGYGIDVGNDDCDCDGDDDDDDAGL